MTAISGNSLEALPSGEREELHKNWYWFLLIGLMLMIFGAIAISLAVLTTISLVIILGWLLIIGGVILIAHIFTRKSRTGLFTDLLSGILYLVTGILILGSPGASAVMLTLLIAVFLIVSGAFITTTAIVHPSPNRGWVLFHGIISLALGFSIYWQWPLSGLWVIGLFVGIEMIFNGWVLVMLGLVVRRLK